MVVYILNVKKLLKPLKIIALALIFTVISTFIVKSFETSDYKAASAKIGPVIIIDAGHGGEDPGAIGMNGVYEKDVNLAIALNIGEELKSKGYTVVYTRTEDKMLYLPEENIKGMRKISDLKNRCKIAAEYEDSVFISIHMNSYGASKYSGLQVYYADKNEESRVLANKIQSQVKKDLQPENNRQIKNGSSLYILENTIGTPVLIECGFLSNENECQKLSQKEYQKELSFSISCAIIEYMKEINGDI